jgi:hypothetical protein
MLINSHAHVNDGLVMSKILIRVYAYYNLNFLELEALTRLSLHKY